MAAITLSTVAQGQPYALLRTATAQATTGQTDWIQVPRWAHFVVVEHNLTAVAGTTPLQDVSFLTPLLATPQNDTGAVNIALHAAFTQRTGAAGLFCQIGPGITGIADDTTTAATGNSQASLNWVLPPVMGIKTLNDRTTGDETYTYTIAVYFRA